MFVVFDCGEAWIYPLVGGRVDYSRTLPWPADWPEYITGRWLSARGIRYATA